MFSSQRLSETRLPNLGLGKLVGSADLGFQREVI